MGSRAPKRSFVNPCRMWWPGGASMIVWQATALTEGQALSFIRSRIAKGTIINADEGSSWMRCMPRVNHEEAYSLYGACTNWAEEFFSRIRRAEAGHHHHIAGFYLLRYAQEASWREDHRRASNGLASGTALSEKPHEREAVAKLDTA